MKTSWALRPQGRDHASPERRALRAAGFVVHGSLPVLSARKSGQPADVTAEVLRAVPSVEILATSDLGNGLVVVVVRVPA